MKQVIFVGWVNKKGIPAVGETVKNQFIISELQKYCKVITLDFYQKKRHPWLFIYALWVFLYHKQASIIFSTSAKNIYGILKLIKLFKIKRHIIHWVVGGEFGHLVKNRHFNPDIFNHIDVNLVQCKDMVKQLEEAGITNARYVSNFKRIDYYPNLQKYLQIRHKEPITRFVFLSRIHPAKGCDYIIQATKQLNQSGFQNKYIVDFYGKIEDSYKNSFLNEIAHLTNISYKGILNLKDSDGYDILSSYHAMLFPTYHPSEGFAGIFIDSFIAGLPVLASDWAYNSECVEDGKDGIIFAAHSITALKTTMIKCINKEFDLYKMAIQARAKAYLYEAENVINEKLIQELGLK